jgi:hypothetical protein
MLETMAANNTKVDKISGNPTPLQNFISPFLPGAPRPTPLPTEVPSISMEPTVSTAYPISQKTTKLDAVEFPCAVDFIDAVSFLNTAKFRCEVQVLETIMDSICKAFLVQDAFGVTFGIVR